MASFGFHFRYRLSGLPPSVRRYPCADGGGLTPGDMASLDAGVARLAATGDVSMLGSVLEPAARTGRHVEVIAD